MFPTHRPSHQCLMTSNPITPVKGDEGHSFCAGSRRSSFNHTQSDTPDIDHLLTTQGPLAPNKISSAHRHGLSHGTHGDCHLGAWGAVRGGEHRQQFLLESWPNSGVPWKEGLSTNQVLAWVQVQCLEPWSEDGALCPGQQMVSSARHTRNGLSRQLSAGIYSLGH